LNLTDNLILSNFSCKDFRCSNHARPVLVLGTVTRVCTFKILMEQRAVIHFLTFKGLLASAIPAKLKSVSETDSLALSTVKKWRKRFAEGRTSLNNGPRHRRSITNDLAEAISSMLKERPSLSCKILYRHFHIAKGTCLRILHDALGMKKFHLRWVPHALDRNQSAKRVTLSHRILSVLHGVRFTGF
jgi:transposase